MVNEKPLAQKKDFYSVRRKAVMTIIQMLNEGKDRNKIYLQIAMGYGYGKAFCEEIIELHIEDQLEKAENDRTIQGNSDQR